MTLYRRRASRLVLSDSLTSRLAPSRSPGNYRLLARQFLAKMRLLRKLRCAMPPLRIMRYIIASLFASILLLNPFAFSQTNLTYQKPPQAIINMVDVLPTPTISLSPATPGQKRWMLIEQFAGLPSIADLAQPELRLAGLRFNPKTDGPSRARYAISLKLQAVAKSDAIAISGLPENAKIIGADWSPDGRKIAFVNISDAKDDAGLSLWIIDVEKAQARRLQRIALDGIFGQPCEWRSDSASLICKTVPADKGAAPVRAEVPTGPVIQENLGRATPGATYEDLLKNPEDETFFDYYATAQLQLISLDGSSKPLGKPGVILEASPSPDGNWLLISELHHPYSYLLPFEFFPQRVSVLNLKNGRSKLLFDRPLQDTIPNVHDAVSAGPREHEWRSDVPASVSWVEAGDGGDPRKDVATRDTIFFLDAPFDQAPRKALQMPLRFERVEWGTDHLALVEERRWKDRKRVILALDPASPGAPAKLFDGSFEDRYHDIGQPIERPNSAGKLVLEMTPDGHGIYFRGMGASPEGDKPFVSAVNSTSGEAKRIWESAAPYYEVPSTVIDATKQTILVRRESQEKNPNYYLATAGSSSPEQITFFPSPYGDAPLPKKQVLHYKRADGVDLSANLYLPVGYKPADGPLPTLMEAYPTEYKTRSSAGQVTGSPYQFPSLSWGSPVPFVTQGYAVLENASIPIIGEGSAEPNDTYVDQLVASARAAIDEGVRLGVVDRNRVAVMGHSYGAFMTANLLAHSDLFKAGIARSGAYNRTLTPFGFQNEERTYWQAPEIYYKMSPFSYADKVKTPLLLIHGEADNNSGTFPIQSERFFSALKGHGATVRFVLLPLESHGYQGRESVLHMFWEMNNWLNTYVKNAGNVATASRQ
jgi:dipeptidyl aminopeptidase/acylaminoacyl peptidase